MGFTTGVCDDRTWASAGPDNSGTIVASYTIVAADLLPTTDKQYVINICDSYGACAQTAVNNFTINTPPEAQNLTAMNWGEADACPVTGTAKAAVLTWKFRDPDSGSQLKRYRVELKDENGNSFATPKVADCDNVGDPIECTGNSNNLNCYDVHGEPDPGEECIFRVPDSWLAWGVSYQWSVTVWDEHGAASSERSFNQNAPYNDTLNSNTLGNSISPHPDLTFTTYKHEFPDVDFSWFTPDPSATEEVLFTDKSIYYYSDFVTPIYNIPSTPPTDCIAGSYSGCTREWSATNGSVHISTPGPTAQQDTIVTFDTPGTGQDVNLRACDVDDYCCELTNTTPSIKEKLPGWKEGAN